jgi:hypothetical protein
MVQRDILLPLSSAMDCEVASMIKLCVLAVGIQFDRDPLVTRDHHSNRLLLVDTEENLIKLL